jgi:hypothetical protein
MSDRALKASFLSGVRVAKGKEIILPEVHRGEIRLREVFDSPNTSLLYTLSYVWRNPIFVFQVSNILLFF